MRGVHLTRSLLFWYWHAWRDSAVAAGVIDAARLSHDTPVIADRPVTGLLRKAGVRLGWWHDFTTMTDDRVRRRLERVASQAPVSEAIVPVQPRFVLRLDDFPVPGVRSEDVLVVHDILATHGVPYLLAVTPFPRRADEQTLSAHEWALLTRVAAEGAHIAVHGFTHESRRPGASNELDGMPAGELRASIARVRDLWHAHGLSAEVFVAPFNGYDTRTFDEVCAHYPIVCGGPESTLSVGRVAPVFFGTSLYLPSYRGIYDIADPEGLGVWRAAARNTGGIIPIALHWANGVRDDFRVIRTLAPRLAGRTLSWTELLAVRRQILELTTD